ncbi:MAG: glucosidase [Bacteroidota bacterium]
MNAENKRLEEAKQKVKDWRKWGPYVSDRQWGTVREDYSADGNAWGAVTHDMARSWAYRWGEDGIAGICDDQQLLCFSMAFWNGQDPIIKERLFGLSGIEGNHGEDVKEYYYYLDNVPSHSYMKYLYKYPYNEFPYNQIAHENSGRGRKDTEFELIDTGIFDDNEYFDIFIEYAKNDAEDILIKVSAANRGPREAKLEMLPQVWFRNTWSWSEDGYKPQMLIDDQGKCRIIHRDLGRYTLYCEGTSQFLFTENETNLRRFGSIASGKRFFKDGINNYVINPRRKCVDNTKVGTKAAARYKLSIPAGETATIRIRLTKGDVAGDPFEQFDHIFWQRIQEANEFYGSVLQTNQEPDSLSIQRQALAGMLWSKQFYHYDVSQWLDGDQARTGPPKSRHFGRNAHWRHLHNADIILMPDKWEYPWYAAWDLAFHCVTMATVDPQFAKGQLILFTREWYMNPNGQLPAYEWEFSDVNPPVHAWATWEVYLADKKKNNGEGDTDYLKSVFHKLLMNFTWWVNKVDRDGNNIFEGGFLGLDNISAFDRSRELPNGAYIEQADGSGWMAMYSLNMMRMALELSKTDAIYQDMATKFFEHFLYIAGAMANIGKEHVNIWDEEDQFFYDVLNLPGAKSQRLKVRSIVGLIPLFVVEVLDGELIDAMPVFKRRMDWFLKYRPDLANLVSHWEVPGSGKRKLLSLLRGHRMMKLLQRMLDEAEFLSDFGIRGMSKHHLEHPYTVNFEGALLSVDYQPGESQSDIFGGNSNWRGPVWFPINFLIVKSLRKFYTYYGDNFKFEFPSGSGNKLNLNEIADEITERLSKIFLKRSDGKRPVFGDYDKLQHDPHFKDYILFYEYFHGENGLGLGASHQTGWTSLVVNLMMEKSTELYEMSK